MTPSARPPPGGFRLHQPEIQEPGQWTRELCAAWVAAVDRLRIGDYIQSGDSLQGRLGEPRCRGPRNNRIIPALCAKAGVPTSDVRGKITSHREVLIDRDAVQNGTAAAGEPWQYYDLGHGYCTYTFFEQCPPPRAACLTSPISDTVHKIRTRGR
jgi:hypothetical protein